MSAINARANELCVVFMICTLLIIILQKPAVFIQSWNEQNKINCLPFPSKLIQFYDIVPLSNDF